MKTAESMNEVQENLNERYCALIDELQGKLFRANRDLKDCRNELCLRCGNYKQKHLGACDGCRWKDMG